MCIWPVPNILVSWLGSKKTPCKHAAVPGSGPTRKPLAGNEQIHCLTLGRADREMRWEEAQSRVEKRPVWCFKAQAKQRTIQIFPSLLDSLLSSFEKWWGSHAFLHLGYQPDSANGVGLTLAELTRPYCHYHREAWPVVLENDHKDNLLKFII